jgi:phosphatidylserine/phosphatidylglycerophosphate/cardiolipin synthase-like enzyme
MGNLAWNKVRLYLVFATLLLNAGCGTAPQVVVVSARTHPVAQAPLGDGTGVVQLLVEPDDGKRKLTRPIRAATHTLDLTMYLLTDHTLIHDLEYAHANGVRVRVILEHHPFGNEASGIGANQSAYDQLYAADIPVHWSSSRYLLTHEKSMVIDNATAYILTLNMTRSAFTKNREFAVIDQNPADVQETEAIFNVDWNDRPYIPHDPNLLLSPINSRARLLALLARAHRSVDVYAEEVQDLELETALIAAAHRGARVRLISNANDPTIARIQHGGVHVHLLSSPYIHAKLVLVDGRWAFVGSENISTASLDRNRELGVLVSDHDALARLAATFEGDWSS